jgi:hypothetical protein
VEAQGIAGVVADLIGLPDWFPKAVRRVAAAVLLITFIISPTTFQRGLSLFAEREAAMFQNRIRPLLDTSARNPSTAHPGSTLGSGTQTPAEDGHTSGR